MIRNRAAASGFICLRCQFQAPAGGWSSPKGQPPVMRIQKAQVLGIGTSSRTQGGHGEDHGRSDGDGGDSDRTERRLAGPTLTQKSQVVYHRKGARVLPKMKDLAVGILGQPAQAIVMKDLGQDRRRPIPIDCADPSDQGAASVDDLQEAWFAWQTPNGPATPGEVQSNIDELRPVGVNIVPQRDFDAIAEVLCSGFTMQQLTEYIRSYHNPDHAPSFQGAQDVTDTPWILERLPWAPGCSPESPSTGHAHLFHGQTLEGRGTKEALVGRLMRECWGVSVRELMDGPGYLDFRVREPEFSLLLVGERRWLQSISRVYLQKVGGRVELRRRNGLVRIFAPKPTAETILDAINDILRTTITKHFDLDLITPGTIMQDTLEHLGRMTNSHICLHQKTRRVSVSWLGKMQSKRDPSWEQTQDVVFRLLLEAYGSHAAVSSPAWTAFPKLDQAQETGSLVVEHSPQQGKLPWHMRTGSWARWVRPLSPWPESADAGTPPDLVPWLLEPFSRDSSSTRQQPSGKPVTGLPGIIESQLSTSAVLGQVLHRIDSVQPVGSRTELPLDSRRPRVLLPATPPLFNAFYSDAEVTGPSNTEILIRLHPSPSHHFASDAPALELHIRVHNGMAVGVKSLRALQHIRSFDILLPDRPVDARITQSQVLDLFRQDTLLESQPSMKPLVEFLAGSQLSLSESHFATPALVPGLGLPAHLVRGATMASVPKGLSDHDVAVVSVDYLFLSLEVRHYVTTTFHGQRLVYTSIVNSAQPGQSRAEVSLQASALRDLDPSTDEGSKAAATKFVDDLIALAKGYQFKWVL